MSDYFDETPRWITQADATKNESIAEVMRFYQEGTTQEVTPDEMKNIIKMALCQ